MAAWEWILGALVLVFGFVVFRGAPYVPSQKKYIRQALTELYPITALDTLVDVGSGDGIVLREAAQLGAHAVGYELNPLLVGLSRLLSWKDKKVDVYLSDFWFARLPEETTVIYAFMVTRDIQKFTRKIQAEANRLRRPLAVVLYGNQLPGKEPTAMLAAYKLYAFVPE